MDSEIQNDSRAGWRLTYRATHKLASEAERATGRKYGGIVSRGFVLHIPGTARVIFVPTTHLVNLGISEQLEYVKSKLSRRFGEVINNIPVS